MKKYITLIALLAAGSTFAHAEQLATLSTLMSEGTTVGTVTDLSFNYAERDTVYSFDGAQVGLTDEQVVNTLAGNTGIIVIASWIKLDTNASQYNTIFGWGEAGTGFKFGTKNDDLFLVTKNVKESVKNFSIAKDVWTLVALQYNLENKQFRLTATEANGQFYTVTDNTVVNPVTTQQFSIGSANGNATSGNENFDGLIGNLTIYTVSGWQNNSDIYNVLGGAPTLIPEPSAFGLLAGLGAIALVGTRRRKNFKA